MSEIRYVHEDKYHQNDNSPQLMVPILKELFQPKSVIDVGCGIGNFLQEFKKCGVEKILGVDGSWADKTKIEKNISLKNFLVFNLDHVFKPEEKFDLAISLEVAEHVDEKYADNFVKTLSNCSDNIIFSAAIPRQGGQHHLNEQWNDYWIEKFSKEGYVCLDILKPYFWDNDEIFWWYKQNILFFTKHPASLKFENKNALRNVIHPELFSRRTVELNDLREFKEKYETFSNGGLPLKDYLSIIMTKLKRKFK